MESASSPSPKRSDRRARQPRQQLRSPRPDDERSPGQRRADALTDVCPLAMARGGLPATGGDRPQLVITIDHDTLLDNLRRAGGGRASRTDDGRANAGRAGTGGTGGQGTDRAGAGDSAGGGQDSAGAGFDQPALDGADRGGGVGYLDTGGRLSAAQLRRIAGDALILPAVLGGGPGQPVDLGQTRRLFTGPLRRVWWPLNQRPTAA